MLGYAVDHAHRAGPAEALLTGERRIGPDVQDRRERGAIGRHGDHLAGVRETQVEQEMPEYGGLRRMVNRGEAVRATIVNGRVVYREGRFADGLGKTWGPGRFLPAGKQVRGATVIPAH